MPCDWLYWHLKISTDGNQFSNLVNVFIWCFICYNMYCSMSEKASETGFSNVTSEHRCLPSCKFLVFYPVSICCFVLGFSWTGLLFDHCVCHYTGASESGNELRSVCLLSGSSEAGSVECLQAHAGLFKATYCNWKQRFRVNFQAQRDSFICKNNNKKKEHI